MENFLRTARDTEENIDPLWYRLDENNKELKERNFQNNVLRILLEQLVDRFHNAEKDRSEVIKDILDFLNEFIKERFIPGAYHDVIKKIFNHAKDLQYKSTLSVTNIIFKELSQNAQRAFRDDGVRVQTSGLTRVPRGKEVDTMQADPMLVEILFLQLVWDAQKRNSTSQRLLSSIEDDMKRMENLFGNDPTYSIVGNFSNLRSTLVEEVQQDSPLPALIKYIVSLIKNSKKEKQAMEEKYKKFLEDKASDEWKEITKVKAKPAVSIWRKKELAPQESEKAKRKRDEKEQKKATKKAMIEKIKGDTLNSVKTKGVSTDTFKGVMDDIMGSISELGGVTNSSGNRNITKSTGALGGGSSNGNLLGNLLGG